MAPDNNKFNSTGTDMTRLIRGIDLVIRNLADNAPALTRRKRHISEIQQHDDNTGNKRGAISNSEFEYNYAPVGLQQQYTELYHLLEKCLVGIQHEASTSNGGSAHILKKTNVSALLMGARGQGKSLVLERCLMALKQKQRKLANETSSESTTHIANNTTTCTNKDNNIGFRVVRLNGILLKGQNVTVVVQEIVSQLCEIVAREDSTKKQNCRLRKEFNTNTSSTENEIERDNQMNTDLAVASDGKNEATDQNTDKGSDKDDALQEKLHTLVQIEAHKFRTRTTTFNSSMACLNEAFQISCIDSIPILIVLDELDSFLPKKSRKDLQSNPSALGKGGVRDGSDSSSSRDLLLYHLLDRIAGNGSLISLVGICARLTTTSSYEKRVRSRAQGTSKVIYFNCGEDKDATNTSRVLYGTLVEVLLSNFDIHMGREGSLEAGFLEELKKRLKTYLLPQSLTESQQSQQGQSAIDEKEMDRKYRIHDIFMINRELGKPTRWFCRVISLALTLYVATVQEMMQEENKIPDFDESYLIEGLSVMGADVFLLEQIPGVSDREGGEDQDHLSIITPNIQDLMDLSSSQAAVLLSATRIMKRDVQSEDDKVPTKALTYERIRREYESYFVAQGKSSGSDRYDEVIFFKAFLQILYKIFFPAKDHTGVGPNQYYFSKKLSEMRHEMLKKTPLHVSVDIERDVMKALAANKLKCSAALKDWAKVSGA